MTDPKVDESAPADAGTASKPSTSLSNSTTNIDLKALKQSRAALKRNLTIMAQKVEKEESLDGTVLECRLQVLESYFKELSHVQTQIERINADDSSRPDIEDAYMQIKSMILKKLNGTRRENIMESSLLNQTLVETLHTHRLPNLKLPKFDGKYGDYKRFIASFNHLVNNDSHSS